VPRSRFTTSAGACDRPGLSLRLPALFSAAYGGAYGFWEGFESLSPWRARSLSTCSCAVLLKLAASVGRGRGDAGLGASTPQIGQGGSL
jgi:hypothetical protein